jgi:hypothetical protein
MLLVAPVAHAYAPMTPQQEALFGIDKLNVVRSALHVRSEPIVCTPEDAFRCFMGTNLDLLVVGDSVVRKQDQDPALKVVTRINLRWIEIVLGEQRCTLTTSLSVRSSSGYGIEERYDLLLPVALWRLMTVQSRTLRGANSVVLP